MGMTLLSIAEHLGGRLKGDGDTIINGLASFDQATASDLCFADDPRYMARLGELTAGAVLVPEDAGEWPGNLIYVKQPRMDFVRLYELFYPGPEVKASIHSSVFLGDGVTLGDPVELRAGVVIGNRVTLGNRVLLYPNVVIGDDVTLGDDVIVHPNVSILDRCVVGNRVTIHAGTVIGSDGYGFVPEGNGYRKIPHTGIVRIGDDVEIGASNTIDRGTHGETIIGNGVKTDNLVHVGHNVAVGDNTLLVAQVGIAGSAVIGEHVILAGQVGVAGHLTIGDNAMVGPKAGVFKSVDPATVVSGIPAMDHKRWMKAQIVVSQLPDLKRKLNAMEKRIKALEANGDT